MMAHARTISGARTSSNHRPAAMDEDWQQTTHLNSKEEGRMHHRQMKRGQQRCSY